MRPTQAALILGLLAAVALVIWLAADLGRGAPKVAGPAPLHSLLPQATARNEALESARATPDAEFGGERSALAPEGGLEDNEALAASAAARRIHGRVVDALGAPLSGARVFAAGARGMALFALDQLEADDVSRFRLETAISGADGSFVLEPIAGDTLRLAVRAKAHAPLRTERALSGPERDELGELVLERGVSLAGRIVDAAGRAVPEAELRALPLDAPGLVFQAPGSRGSLLAITDGAGRFELDELAAGPYRIAVRHPDHPDAIEEGRTEAPGELRSGLLIRLEEGFAITGRVLGLAAGGAPEHRVRAWPIESEQRFEAEREALLEADGAFRLRGLRGGREYLLKLVEAQAGPFGSERSAAVLARPGDSGVTLELAAGFAVVGRVVDARTQAPIERFVVEAGSAWLSPQTDAEGEPVLEHAGGDFRYERIEILSAHQPVSVRVRAEGYASFTRKNLPLPADRSLELGLIELEPVPYLTVLVLDAVDEGPVHGARVLLAPVPEGDALRELAFTFDEEGAVQADSDALGSARLPSLAGRRCTLHVTHAGFAPFASEPFELPASGDAVQRVHLSKGGTVEVLVRDRAGAPVAAMSVIHRERATRGRPVLAAGVESDASGVVRFERLAEGAHAFRLVDPSRRGGTGSADDYFALLDAAGVEEGEGWVEVQLADGGLERITLELPPQASLRGRVTEAGKPLPGAMLLLEELEARPAHLSGLGGGARAATDGRGAFALENVRAGDWRLRVQHASRAMDSVLGVRLVEGSNELELSLDLAVIEGRITDEEGRAVTGARVRVWRAASEGAGAGSEALTDAAGGYQLRGVATSEPLVVEARAAGCQTRRSAPLELRPGETRGGVDLALDFGGRVEVLVFDREGKPAGFVLVSAEYAGHGGDGDADGDDVAPAREFVQEGGRAIFQGLQPGPWRFTARSLAFGGEGRADLYAEPVRVEVVARETRSARIDLR